MWKKILIPVLLLLLVCSLVTLYRSPRQTWINESFCPCGQDLEEKFGGYQGFRSYCPGCMGGRCTCRDKGGECMCGGDCSCRITSTCKEGFTSPNDSPCPVQKCPLKRRYPLKQMYQIFAKSDGVNPMLPYYKRSWEECNPFGCTRLGESSDCRNQAYIDPEYFEDMSMKEFGKKYLGKNKSVHEKFSLEKKKSKSEFPTKSLSCQPSCNTETCDVNPYGQHYEDPRWRSGRFWTRQEWVPGMLGYPEGQLYPTAPQTS